MAEPSCGRVVGARRRGPERRNLTRLRKAEGAFPIGSDP
jgi:hypothetical protein